MVDRVRGQGGGAVAEKRSGMVWMTCLAPFLGLIPIGFEIATLQLSPLRLYLLIVTPFLIINWLRGAYGKLTFGDYAMMAFCGWLTLSIAQGYSFGVVQFAGSHVMLVIGGYLLGRAGVRSAADFRAMAWAMILAALLVLPLGVHESFGHNPSVVLVWLQENGFDTHNDSQMCCRIGLDRAQAVFIHPIHYGIFSAVGLSLALLALANHVDIVTRWLLACLTGLGAVTTVSSTAVLMLGTQLILIVYALSFHRAPWQWKLAIRGGLAGYVLIELNTTKFAFITLAEKIAFSPGNVWIRQLFIEIGMDLMRQYPLFGYGFRRWPMPHWFKLSTVDNHWMVLGGSFGIPTLLFAAAAFLHPLIFAGGTRIFGKQSGGRLRKGSDLYWCRIAWTVMLIALILSMGSVYIWDVMSVIVYMLLGSGLFLMYATEPDADTAPDGGPVPQRPRGPVYSRFPTSPGRLGSHPASARTQARHAVGGR